MELQQIKDIYAELMDKYFLKDEYEIDSDFKKDIIYGQSLHGKFSSDNSYVNVDFYFMKDLLKETDPILVKKSIYSEVWTDLVKTTVNQFATDNLCKEVYDAGFKYDANENSILNTIRDIKTDVDWLHRIAYEIANQDIKMSNLLKLKKRSKNPEDLLLATLFSNWCRETWCNNTFSMPPLLEYPERACLRFNTIQLFQYDLDAKLNNDEFWSISNYDTFDLQSKIMAGLGVPETQKEMEVKNN